ncbi:ethanolamine utilization cobalamin adenosyltransferase, partial [Candidatus Hakubella thermalkaliphila]
AWDFISNNNIRVIFSDQDSITEPTSTITDVVSEEGPYARKVGPEKREYIHPLTGRPPDQVIAHCELCGQEVSKKSEYITHLNEEVLVYKNHPRIKLRGKLDSLLAHILIAQSLAKKENRDELVQDLESLRVYVSKMIRCEVKEERLEALEFKGLKDEEIRKWIHNPIEYVGRDHLIPAVEDGEVVLMLNLLRTEVREAEIAAMDAFQSRDHRCERMDIIFGLNRMSSALYLLMMMASQNMV